MIKSVIRNAGILCFISMFILLGSANAEILCRKKNANVVNGKVKLAAALSSTDTISCPSGLAEVVDGGKTLIAHGRVSTAGALLSFGGSQVSSASASSSGTGDRIVSFIGSFPELSGTDGQTNWDKLAVTCTARTGAFAVCNSYIAFANNSRIDVEVYSWVSNVESEVDASDLQVAVYVANE